MEYKPTGLCDDPELLEFIAFIGENVRTIPAHVSARPYSHCDRDKHRLKYTVAYKGHKCLEIARTDGCVFEVYLSDPAAFDGYHHHLRCRFFRPACHEHKEGTERAWLEGVDRVIPCMARVDMMRDGGETDGGERSITMHVHAENQEQECGVWLKVDFFEPEETIVRTDSLPAASAGSM